MFKRAVLRVASFIFRLQGHDGEANTMKQRERERDMPAMELFELHVELSHGLLGIFLYFPSVSYLHFVFIQHIFKPIIPFFQLFIPVIYVGEPDN